MGVPYILYSLDSDRVVKSFPASVPSGWMSEVNAAGGQMLQAVVTILHA